MRNALPKEIDREFQRALEVELGRRLETLQTEPLSIQELAKYFGVHRNLMALLLREMHGVERCRSMYRLPLWKMPPAYLLARGILRPLERAA